MTPSTPLPDKVSFAKDAQMLRNGGPAHIETAREVLNGLISRTKPVEQGTPGSVGDSVKYVNGGAGMSNHLVTHYRADQARVSSTDLSRGKGPKESKAGRR